MKTLANPRDRDEILRRWRGMRSDRAARWGRMSAPQMVCHVNDSLRMAMAERPAAPYSRWVTRTVLRWVVLYAPLRWPSGVATNPEIDQEGGGTRPGVFAADLREGEELVERVLLPATRLEGNEHPLFGRMTRRAWLRWSYLHMDHHLRQFGA